MWLTGIKGHFQLHTVKTERVRKVGERGPAAFGARHANSSEIISKQEPAAYALLLRTPWFSEMK